MPLRDAKIKLQNAGVTIGDVTTATSETMEADNVLVQSPGAGSRVGMDARVSLIVSSGKFRPRVAVPALVGKTLGEAQTTLQSQSLMFGTITYVHNTSVLSRTVLSQQPAPGDSLDAGSPVNLTGSSD